MLQEAQIERSADGVLLVEHDGPAVVAPLQRSFNSPGIVVPFRAGLDIAYLVGVAPRVEGDCLVWLDGVRLNVWTFYKGRTTGLSQH
jgi:hypothetical protein